MEYVCDIFLEALYSSHLNKAHFQDKHTKSQYNNNKMVSDQEEKQTRIHT